MVSFDFLDRRGAERFAELLEETSGGSHRHHGRGSAEEQLAELVAIGHGLAGARTGVRVDPEFRTGLRAMLVATADRDGIGQPPVPEDEPNDKPAPRGGRGLLGKGSARRIRARGAIVIGVAAGAMAVSGVSAASESAAPGDALYGVKRSTERAQLAMAGSDLTRGQLSLNFARNRLVEAGGLDGDNTKFGQVLDDMDDDTRQGVRLLTASAVARKEKILLNAIDIFVSAQRARMVPVLDGLSPANRQRTTESISLLETVHERSDALRAGLACATLTPAGSDTLGPKLAGCLSGSDGFSTSPHEPGASEKQGTKPDESPRRTRPEQTDKGAEPSPSAKIAKTPARARIAPSASGHASPTPAAVAPEPDDDAAGQEDEILNGAEMGYYQRGGVLNGVVEGN